MLVTVLTALCILVSICSAEQSTPTTTITSNVTVFLWGMRGDTWNTEVLASVIGADATAGTYQLHCRTDIPPSKCHELEGTITQGASVHIHQATNSDKVTSIGCFKTADNANFGCTLTTAGEKTARVFTVGANQWKQFPVPVTAGAEKVSGLPAATSMAATNEVGRIAVGRIGKSLVGMMIGMLFLS